ncbi:MAG: universal stress protein [Burkholderiales bacterium]
MYRRILVALEGSEPSERALAEAIRLAKHSAGSLRCVFVARRPATFGNPMANVAAIIDAVEVTGTRALEQAAEAAKRAGVPVETRFVEANEDPVAKTIIREANAWDADLIAMGTHGRRGVDHFLVGSVAEGVIREASKPVLLIRAI